MNKEKIDFTKMAPWDHRVEIRIRMGENAEWIELPIEYFNQGNSEPFFSVIKQLVVKIIKRQYGKNSPAIIQNHE